jgi:hypothetical protein
MTEKYSELFDKAPAGSDEAFMQGVYRKVNTQRQGSSVFKPLYALTALILVIGVAYAGFALNGGFPPNAPLAGGYTEEPQPPVTAEYEIIYADSESLIFTITITADGERELPFNNFYFDPRGFDFAYFSTTQTIEASPYSATYKHYFFLVDTKITEGDVIPFVYGIRQEPYNIFEIDINVVADKFETENLVTINLNQELKSGSVLTEIKLNPQNIWFVYGEREKEHTSAADWRDTIEFKTHCGEIFDARNEYYKNTYSYYLWDLFRIEYAEGFGVHDIAAVIYNGEEIPLTADVQTGMITAEQAIEILRSWQIETFGDYRTMYPFGMHTEPDEIINVSWDDIIYAAELVENAVPGVPPIWHVQYRLEGQENVAIMFVNALTGEITDAYAGLQPAVNE